MKDYPKLTPAEVMHLDSGICPDCGSPRFLEGSFGKERISEKSPARQKILDAVFTPLA